jgi:hypothetical protein
MAKPDMAPIAGKRGRALSGWTELGARETPGTWGGGHSSFRREWAGCVAGVLSGMAGVVIVRAGFRNWPSRDLTNGS